MSSGLVISICLLLWLLSSVLVIKRTELEAPIKYVWAILIYPLVIFIFVISIYSVEFVGYYLSSFNKNELLDVYIYPVSALLILPLSFLVFFIFKRILFTLVGGYSRHYPKGNGLLNYLLREVAEITATEEEYPDIKVKNYLVFWRARFIEGVYAALVMASVASSLLVYFKLRDYGI